MPNIAANALVAAETRHRCDRIEDGAIVNRRGDAAEKGEHADRLVSIRFWVRGGRVNSVTRRPLAAMKAVVALAEAGRIHDPGALLAAFARDISRELDPPVAALGDTLHATETQLDQRNLHRPRRTITATPPEALTCPLLPP